MGRDTGGVPRQTPRFPSLADLAVKRLVYERTRPDRDWSTSEVARQLTEQGFKISQSSVWSIENDPRRKLTFAEAVAFAELYELPLDELIQPPRDIGREFVTGVQKEIDGIERDGRALAARLSGLLVKVEQLNDEPPEQLAALFKYLGISEFPVSLSALKLQLVQIGGYVVELAHTLPDEAFAITFDQEDDGS